MTYHILDCNVTNVHKYMNEIIQVENSTEYQVCIYGDRNIKYAHVHVLISLPCTCESIYGFIRSFLSKGRNIIINIHIIAIGIENTSSILEDIRVHRKYETLMKFNFISI